MEPPSSAEDPYGGEFEETPEDTEHSLPTAEEARFQAALTGSNPYSGKRKRYLALFAVILVAVFAIVGFSVGISNNNHSSVRGGTDPVSGGDPNPAPEEPAPEGPAPEEPDPVPPTRDEPSFADKIANLEGVHEYLVAREITSRSDLEDITGPQHQASFWIANVDVRDLHIPTTDAEALVFDQRYVLATFYFALQGQKWVNKSMGFLNEKSECSWHLDLRSAEDADEVKWKQGVTCNDKGEVSEIFITGNGLEGSIPSEIGRLSALEHISLYNNTISGQLPERMKELTNLQFVAIESNELSGSLPSWINQWTNVESIALGDNSLTGPIPSLQELTSLTELALDFNQFSGSVDVLNDVPTLEHVYLNDNLFEGRIHDNSFKNHPNLNVLDLSDNVRILRAHAFFHMYCTPQFLI